jgi:hypothetical protein
MKHNHNGVEYRGSSIFNFQNRKIGQWYWQNKTRTRFKNLVLFQSAFYYLATLNYVTVRILWPKEKTSRSSQ